MEAADRDLADITRSVTPAWADGRRRDVLERAERVFRSSALVLRANGRSAGARHVEQFADLARFHLDEPALTAIQPGDDSQPGSGLAALLEEVLDFALELLHTDRGNVQLADPVTGALSIAAHRGFDAEFLDYFAVVRDEAASACGRAAQQGAQVVIADVRTDPGFAPHREIAAASGFRAVQSTPLVASDGRLVGMLSTHYPRPATLTSRDLLLVRRFGTQIGNRLGRLLMSPPSRASAPGASSRP